MTNRKENLASRWSCLTQTAGQRQVMIERNLTTCRLRTRFALACCHEVSGLIVDVRSLRALKESERCADRKYPFSRMQHYVDSAYEAAYDGRSPVENRLAYQAVAVVASSLLADEVTSSEISLVAYYAQIAAGRSSGVTPPVEQVVYRQGQILDSFTSKLCQPAWRTSNAVGLASCMYQKNDFANAPILADALEEAGCSDVTLLDSLRDSTCPWYRGNRVFDYLRGES